MLSSSSRTSSAAVGKFPFCCSIGITTLATAAPALSASALPRPRDPAPLLTTSATSTEPPVPASSSASLDLSLFSSDSAPNMASGAPLGVEFCAGGQTKTDCAWVPRQTLAALAWNTRLLSNRVTAMCSWCCVRPLAACSAPVPSLVRWTRPSANRHIASYPASSDVCCAVVDCV